MAVAALAAASIIIVVGEKSDEPGNNPAIRLNTDPSGCYSGLTTQQKLGLRAQRCYRNPADYPDRIVLAGPYLMVMIASCFAGKACSILLAMRNYVRRVESLPQRL